MPARERFEVAEGRRSARRAEAPRRLPAHDKFEARREQIVAAAIAPLNRHGLRGMTLSEVAQRLGLAPSAVGYYFRRKEDLASACYLASIRRLETMIDETSQTEQPLQEFIRRFFAFRQRVELGEEPEIAWFEDVRTLKREEVNEAYIAFYRKIRALFGPAQSEAARIARNARTHLLTSQLYWAVSWLPQYHAQDYPRMAERLIDILENGLAAPGMDPAPRPLSLQLDEGADPRSLFLRAATELINELGYLGASVQKISEKLNVTKGAFYHRHDAKSDLVSQCFARTWKLVAEAQAAADRETNSGLQNLASVATFLVEQQVSGETPMIRSAALAAVPAELRPDLVAGFTRTANRFASVICDGLADGSVRPLEVQLAAYVLNGAINAAVELPHWAQSDEPMRLRDPYVRAVFLGVLPRPAPE
jgi:AcrR family transcriptional regulator